MRAMQQRPATPQDSPVSKSRDLVFDDRWQLTHGSDIEAPSEASPLWKLSAQVSTGVNSKWPESHWRCWQICHHVVHLSSACARRHSDRRAHHKVVLLITIVSCRL